MKLILGNFIINHQYQAIADSSLVPGNTFKKLHTPAPSTLFHQLFIYILPNLFFVGFAKSKALSTVQINLTRV